MGTSGLRAKAWAFRKLRFIGTRGPWELRAAFDQKVVGRAWIWLSLRRRVAAQSKDSDRTAIAAPAMVLKVESASCQIDPRVSFESNNPIVRAIGSNRIHRHKP